MFAGEDDVGDTGLEGDGEGGDGAFGVSGESELHFGKGKGFDPGDGEDVVVEVVEVRGHVVEGEVEAVVAEGDGGGAVARVFVFTGKISEGMRGLCAFRAGDGIAFAGFFGKLLGLFLIFLEARGPVDGVEAEEAVVDGEGGDGGERLAATIGEDDHTDFFVGDEGEEGGEAVDAAAVGDEGVAAVGSGAEGHAVTIEGEFGEGDGAAGGNEHLRGLHLGGLRGGEDLLVAEFAFVHVQGEVAGHFFDAGVDGAGGANGVNVTEGDRGGLVFHQNVGQGEVVAILGNSDREIRVGHVEGGEDTRADEVFPFGAGDFCGEHTGGHEHEVVVLPEGTEIAGRLEVAEAVEHLLTGGGGAVPDEIVAGEAGAVGDEVAGSGALGGDDVVKLEGGEVGADGLVPFEFFFVGEGAEDGDGERFGDAANGEEGLRGDGELFGDVAVAVAFGVDDRTVFDDDEGEAGDFPVFEGLIHEVVEAGEGVGFLLGGKRENDEEGEGEEGGKESAHGGS